MKRRRTLLLLALALLAWLAHGWAARALVDDNVGGVLFAGGGSWRTLVVAVGFLATRLLGFVALACLPAVVITAAVARRYPSNGGDGCEPAPGSAPR